MGPYRRRGDRWVFLHGFTQTHRSWNPLIGALFALGRTGSIAPPALTLIDMPGHGLSRSPTQSGLDDDARAIIALAGAGTYVGYSMGGRFALTAAALDEPTSRRIDRLVLISTTPGLDDADERANRADDDGDRADRLIEIGVTAFVDEWLAQPMFERLDAADIDDRRANTADGLAASLRNSGTGAQRPLWDDLERITIPVLIIVGAEDRKFADIGRRMVERFPNATMATIPSAGHAVHNEAPGATASAIAEWSASTESPAPTRSP